MKNIIADSRHQMKGTAPRARAFTLLELLVVVALLVIWGALLVPALGHTRPNAQLIQCQNNLRQLGYAWKMYTTDNSGFLVSSYPQAGTTWCYGTADDTGTIVYGYDCTDPMGIKVGLLWPYTRQTSIYKCSASRGVARTGAHKGLPVVRSVSMNSCLCGRSYGDPNGTWVFSSYPATPSSGLKYTIYVKEAQILRPAQKFVMLEEDPVSINDPFFIVDEETGLGLVDLPNRLHAMSYGMNFADGHSQFLAFKDRATYQAWTPGGVHSHDADWLQIRDLATSLAMP